MGRQTQIQTTEINYKKIERKLIEQKNRYKNKTIK